MIPSDGEGSGESKTAKAAGRRLRSLATGAGPAGAGGIWTKPCTDGHGGSASPAANGGHATTPPPHQWMPQGRPPSCPDPGGQPELGTGSAALPVRPHAVLRRSRTCQLSSWG